MRGPALLALALMLAAAPRAAAQDSPGALLDRLEAAWAARSPGQYLSLWKLADTAAREREEAFAQMAFASADPRLLLERPPAWPAGPQAVVLARSMGIDEPRARVEQWRLRLERTPAGWRLAGRELLGRLDGLVHLSLDPAGFRADGLALRLPDFELRFERGTLFTSPPALGPTALVFVGQATVRMTPRPPTEREQLRRFAGQPELVERVEQAFVRLHPADWHYVLSQGRELQPDPQAGARLAADFPLIGAGLASFPGLYAHYIQVVPFYVLPFAHNLYLDIAITQGILGALAFVAVYALSIAALIRPRRLIWSLPLWWATLTGLIVILIHGLVDNVVYNQATAPIAFLAFLMPGYAAAVLSGIAFLLALAKLPESRHADSATAARHGSNAPRP